MNFRLRHIARTCGTTQAGKVITDFAHCTPCMILIFVHSTLYCVTFDFIQRLVRAVAPTMSS